VRAEVMGRVEARRQAAIDWKGAGDPDKLGLFYPDSIPLLHATDTLKGPRMKIFISSLITGLEDIRAAVREAIEQLGHDAVMAEDFGAQPNSPQMACLMGLRQSGLVILVLGASYGAKQASGLSATHEEYREAQGTRPVIAFVQEDVSRDADDAKFVTEVQGWEGGLFRGGFKTAEQLRSLVTRAIHQWELSNAASPMDGQEILARALAALPDRDRQARGVELVVSIAGGPAQPLLRPSEIEAPNLAEDMLQAALFGSNRIFSHSVGSDHQVRDHALHIEQDKDKGSIVLDAQGSLLFRSGLDGNGSHGGVIEEDIADRLMEIFRYAAWALDRIDPAQRLSHIAVAVTLLGRDYMAWRNRAEHNASPNSYSVGFGNARQQPVHLTPGHRPRAALKLNSSQLIEDLVTLLRREWKT
jgi:hypothetical protein